MHVFLVVVLFKWALHGRAHACLIPGHGMIALCYYTVNRIHGWETRWNNEFPKHVFY